MHSLGFPRSHKQSDAQVPVSSFHLFLLNDDAGAHPSPNTHGCTDSLSVPSFRPNGAQIHYSKLIFSQ
jgi:hypothetical protein